MVLSLRVYGVHMCVVLNGIWSLRVYSTEEKALVFPDDPVVELLGQFGVLVDEPGLPQHISRSTLQLHTQTTHDKLRRHQNSVFWFQFVQRNNCFSFKITSPIVFKN